MKRLYLPLQRVVLSAHYAGQKSLLDFPFSGYLNKRVPCVGQSAAFSTEPSAKTRQRERARVAQKNRRARRSQARKEEANSVNRSSRSPAPDQLSESQKRRRRRERARDRERGQDTSNAKPSIQANGNYPLKAPALESSEIVRERLFGRNERRPDSASKEAKKQFKTQGRQIPQQQIWQNQGQQFRSEASQFVPLWLRRDKTWRKQVMQHLNLPSNIVESNGKNLVSEAVGGNFYQDSIPSFSDTLKGDPPASLKGALDMLVDVGLSIRTVADNYRKTVRSRVKRGNVILSIEEKKKQLAHRQEIYNETKTILEDVKKRLAELPPVEVDSSLLKKAVSSLITVLKSEEDIKTEELATKRNAKKRENLEAMLEIKKSHLMRHQAALDSINAKLSMLKDELAAAKPPLTDEEYQLIQAAAKKAMPAIARAFAEHIQVRHSAMLEQYQALDAKTDLTRPQEWFPHARLDRRKIIYHGGPTNSGKTYMALERLKTASKGMYLGPLRLLAAEVYETLTGDGIYCSLMTGQERRNVPFATHIAATVEMGMTAEEFEVIVIDEIQMIADKERGFAWSRALLGSRCKEIHVCGGMEGLEVVKRITEACGDELEVRQYERFSELEVEGGSLAPQQDMQGCYKSVQAGDCVVAFSRNDIFAIKREIESTTKFKCCVIYGSLPPSTRSEQARRFNDPDSGYDILVASDAIGMGLNLNIRRIIFNSVFKNKGDSIVRLDHSAMKQISGRAGRRNSPFPNGVVTTRDPRDMDYLRECMTSDIASITNAGLLPTATHIETFSNALESYGLGHGPKNLHKVLLQFSDMANMKSGYFLCKQAPMVQVAAEIAPLDLSIPDKYIFCQSPVITRSPNSMGVMKRFASKVAAGQVAGLTHHMKPKVAKSFEDLSHLCGVFSDLELFLWLQQKFPPANVMEQHNATTRKEQTIDFIGKALAITDKLKLTHCYVTRDRNLRQTWIDSESKEKGEDPNDGVEDDEWR